MRQRKAHGTRNPSDSRLTLVDGHHVRVVLRHEPAARARRVEGRGRGRRRGRRRGHVRRVGRVGHERALAAAAEALVRRGVPVEEEGRGRVAVDATVGPALLGVVDNRRQGPLRVAAELAAGPRGEAPRLKAALADPVGDEGRGTGRERGAGRRAVVLLGARGLGRLLDGRLLVVGWSDLCVRLGWSRRLCSYSPARGDTSLQDEIP